MAKEGSDGGPVTYTPKKQVPSERNSVEAALSQISGVRGVGEGQDDIGDPTWVAYVTDKFVAEKLPEKLRGRRVVAEVTGEIDILPK
jgi:hypothetical protein